jgi:hypothetical protein
MIGRAINPYTGRAIDIGGKTYKSVVEHLRMQHSAGRRGARRAGLQRARYIVFGPGPARITPRCANATHMMTKGIARAGGTGYGCARDECHSTFADCPAGYSCLHYGKEVNSGDQWCGSCEENITCSTFAVGPFGRKCAPPKVCVAGKCEISKPSKTTPT